ISPAVAFEEPIKSALDKTHGMCLSPFGCGNNPQYVSAGFRLRLRFSYDLLHAILKNAEILQREVKFLDGLRGKLGLCPRLLKELAQAEVAAANPAPVRCSRHDADQRYDRIHFGAASQEPTFQT